METVKKNYYSVVLFDGLVREYTYEMVKIEKKYYIIRHEVDVKGRPYIISQFDRGLVSANYNNEESIKNNFTGVNKQEAFKCWKELEPMFDKD